MTTQPITTADGKMLHSRVEGEIEIVTPLHIGNCEELGVADVASVFGLMHRIDPRKFGAKLLAQPDGDKALEELDNPRLVADELLSARKIKAEDVAEYSVRMMTRRPIRPGDMVLPFARAGVNRAPFLPGSSLKGALVSGLLWMINAEARDAQTPSWVSERFKDMLAKCRQARFPSDGPMLAELLGRDSHNSLSRLLHVPDIAISPDDLRVYHTGLFHVATPHGGYAWSTFRGEKSRDMKLAQPTFIEAVRPGARLRFTLEFDEFLAREAQREGARVSMPSEGLAKEWFSPHSLLSGMMDLAYNTLWQERQVFQRAGEEKLSARYADLFARCEKLAENEVMFRCGWGMNWHGVTGYLWDDPTAKELSLPAYPYRNLPYPKTRKIVFDGETPVGTPGWAILRVLGQR